VTCGKEVDGRPWAEDLGRREQEAADTDSPLQYCHPSLGPHLHLFETEFSANPSYSLELADGAAGVLDGVRTTWIGPTSPAVAFVEERPRGFKRPPPPPPHSLLPSPAAASAPPLPPAGSQPAAQAPLFGGSGRQPDLQLQALSAAGHYRLLDSLVRAGLGELRSALSAFIDWISDSRFLI
jgi:hypothetical protein